MLSLTKAVKTGRLQDFIAQEEARGVGSADKTTFFQALSSVIKQPQSEDRTLRSASGDYSPET
jgi:hypothetical protein